MNIDTLNTLDKLPLDEARTTAMTLVDPKKTKKVVQNRLAYDVSKARTSAEVSRIMWNVYMSGSGFGTIGSAWKKHYNAA